MSSGLACCIVQILFELSSAINAASCDDLFLVSLFMLWWHYRIGRVVEDFIIFRYLRVDVCKTLRDFNFFF